MNWPATSLGALIEEDSGLIQTGPFGSQLKEFEYADEGVPVIMPKDIFDGGVDGVTVARVSEATANRLSRHKIKSNGIVLPRRGEITKRAFITDEQEGWLCGTGCIKIEATGKKVLPRFLYYYLAAPKTVEWLERNATGSTMLNLSTGIVSKLPVVHPDVAVQEKIVSLLLAYDQAIANNRRRIELLERSARLFYREWFVRLKYPAHEHDKIVDGVPKGWKIRPLAGVVRTNIDSYPARALPEEINYIDISSVQAGRIIQKTRLKAAEAPGRARRKIKDGDVIWSNVRPNLRQYALVIEPQAEDVVSTGFTVLTPVSVPSSFLYIAATTDNFVQHLVNHTTGASYPAVRPDDFERAQLLIPSANLLADFHSICDPMFRLANKLDAQNKKLSEARDYLLPRLMDGRISV